MPKAITASTQDHLPIEDIADDIVVLKDGSCCLIIQTTAVNFGLLSEKEQDVTIFSYAALLNSLSHPIQILIRSKKTDISQYIDQLKEAYQKQTNPGLKTQIGKYIEFVKATVRKGKVLDKKFYVVIPFSFFELGVTKAAGALTKRTKALPYPKEYLVEQAKINLYPKKDNLLKQLTRVGLVGRVLTQPELVELFFDIYNPEAVGAQKITAESETYTGPIIEPAFETPAGAQVKKPQEEATPKPQTPTPEASTQPQEPQLQESQTLKSQEQKISPVAAETSTPIPIQEAKNQTQAQASSTPPSQDSEKLLRELQEVISKAREGLTVKTQAEEQASENPKISEKTQGRKK